MNIEFSRREFLRRLTMVGAGAVLLPLAAADGAPPRFVPAGKIDAFPVGEYKNTTLPDGTVVFVRRLAGHKPSFHALGAHCTHKGCVVAWTPHVQQFICPCHGGRFDAQGKNIAGPPPLPLPTLATKVVGGVVMVAA